MSKVVKITSGGNGFGGPLYLKAEGKRDKVVSMTGGGIHPVAGYIAELLGTEAVDGFKKPVSDSEIVCVVINCGGTLRCGVYSEKRIPTININPVGASGPLAKYITEDIYVSDVKRDNITILGDGETGDNGFFAKKAVYKEIADVKDEENALASEKNSNLFIAMVEKIANAMGFVISMFYGAGKESVEVILKSVIPFMAFISVIIAAVLYSGLGQAIARALSPLASSIWGLLLISVICGIPFLSPLIGPGAAIAQVIGVLIGTEIALGHIPPQYALPALFAINVQVGADFVPVGLSMQEAKPKTIEYGTPAFLISRQITGPLAVIIAYFLSIGLFK